MLITKGGIVQKLVVFKKGTYDLRATRAKKEGFRGDIVVGIAIGSGANLTLQLPATEEVAAAMSATGQVCESEPCTSAKLRTFLLDHKLKFKRAL